MGFFRAYRINQISLKDSSLLPSLALRNWFYVDGEIQSIRIQERLGYVRVECPIIMYFVKSVIQIY